MKLRPLVINKQVEARVAEVKAYAERNILTFAELEKLVHDRDFAVGNSEENVCNIDFGYRVVYSLEEQLKAGKPDMCHHLSVSVHDPNNKEACPSEIAVMEICKLFGFPFGTAIAVYVEKSDFNPAVNVVAPVKP